ncbi:MULTISPECIES: hypothetical protein [Lactobacillaceae]|uniref:hypothetical protein n=1 Tax=Lactobacillaceae TaxID=33958 RepID=UPI0014566873|nr:hypothetical protein [Lactobacillus sp. HBUAS51381]NLR08646.1 hypothetical protein [Lactobacillus sp. HBUAS51381]
MKKFFKKLVYSLVCWFVLTLISLVTTGAIFICGLHHLIDEYGKKALIDNHVIPFQLLILKSLTASILLLFIILLSIRMVQTDYTLENKELGEWTEIRFDFLSKFNGSLTAIITAVTAFTTPFLQNKTVGTNPFELSLPLLIVVPLSVAVPLIQSLSKQE